MKTLKKKILLSLSLPTDFLSQSAAYGYKPYRYFYFLLSFKPSSIRDAIGQLVKSGEVDKIQRNRASYFRLTSLGRERLKSFFPLANRKAWNGDWQMVICPREGGKLVKMGFQRLTRGVYLSPCPFPDYLLLQKSLSKAVFIKKCRFLAPEPREIALKIWHLDDLAQKQHHFINQCQQLLKKITEEKRLKNQDKMKVVALFDNYFSLLSSDPGLPKSLLPDDFPSDMTRKIFLKIFDRLETQKLLDIF